MIHFNDSMRVQMLLNHFRYLKVRLLLSLNFYAREIKNFSNSKQIQFQSLDNFLHLCAKPPTVNRQSDINGFLISFVTTCITVSLPHVDSKSPVSRVDTIPFHTV